MERGDLRCARGGVLWAVLLVLAAQMIALLLVIDMWRSRPQPEQLSDERMTERWASSQQYEYANLLLAKGMNALGAEALEQSVAMADAGGPLRAKLAYRIGMLWREEGQYERALKWFYQVELADPDSPLLDQAGKQIVECLERLGFTRQAKYELESRTSLTPGNRPELSPDRVVVARIGSLPVYQSDVDAMFNLLPEPVKRQFESPTGMQEFLRQYVAKEILYRKGERLGYDRDPDLRRRHELLMKQLVVDRVIGEELARTVSVSPDDVKRYYDANQSRYVKPATYRLSLIQCDTKEAADLAHARLEQGEAFDVVAREVSRYAPTSQPQGSVSLIVPKGGGFPDLGRPEPLWQALEQVSMPGYTAPVEWRGAWWIVYAHEQADPERPVPFEEVRDRVTAEYRAEKEVSAIQELLGRVLQEQSVEFYDDRLQQDVQEQGL